MKSGVFGPFAARMKRKKNVQFAWIVEAQSYATFQKQNYEGKGGEHMPQVPLLSRNIRRLIRWSSKSICDECTSFTVG